MKVELNRNQVTISKTLYPYLGEYKAMNLIVLFYAPRTGTVVSGNDIGSWGTNWSENNYVKYEGSIKLEND